MVGVASALAMSRKLDDVAAQKSPLNGDHGSEPAHPCLKLLDALAKTGNVVEVRVAGNDRR